MTRDAEAGGAGTVRSFAPYAYHALTDGVFCSRAEAEGYAAVFLGVEAAVKACERSIQVRVHYAWLVTM